MFFYELLKDGGFLISEVESEQRKNRKNKPTRRITDVMSVKLADIPYWRPATLSG
jgi:hypothetical protein